MHADFSRLSSARHQGLAWLCTPATELQLTGLWHQCLPAALRSQLPPKSEAACTFWGPPGVLLLHRPRSQEPCSPDRRCELNSNHRWEHAEI
jgi:hypothetical protein